jgi:hypothetical protein
MSEAQMVWCARHGLEYDPAWSRGVANVMIDKFTVEVGVWPRVCVLVWAGPAVLMLA